MNQEGLSWFILHPSSFILLFGVAPLQRYFLEPYRFIPPYRGTFWCRIASQAIPRHLRRKMGVMRFAFEGLEQFRSALEQKAGILLAANHSRWSDPMVLGVTAWQLRQYLYYV